MFEEVERILDANLSPIFKALKNDCEEIYHTEMALWSNVARAAVSELKAAVVSFAVLLVCVSSAIVLLVTGGAAMIVENNPGVSGAALIVLAAAVLGICAFAALYTAENHAKKLSILSQRSMRLH